MVRSENLSHIRGQAARASPLAQTPRIPGPLEKDKGCAVKEQTIVAVQGIRGAESYGHQRPGNWGARISMMHVMAAIGKSRRGKKKSKSKCSPHTPG